MTRVKEAAFAPFNIVAFRSPGQAGSLAFWHAVVLPVAAAWMAFHGCWTSVKGRVNPGQ